MADISTWDPVDANNQQTPPDGWKENAVLFPDINNIGRGMFGAIRRWYDNPHWRDLGDTPTRIDATAFTLVGDLTATYLPGTRIRCTESTPSTFYGTIETATFSSPNTTVTLTLDSGALTANLTNVALGYPTDTASLGNQLYPTNSQSSSYTTTKDDFNKIVLADASGGAFTVTLLDAATAGDGFVLAIKKTDSSTNFVTIDGDGSETIDGETSIDLTSQYDSVVLECDGSNWHIKTEAIDQGVVNENIIINGNFNVWQRQTSFVSPFSGDYTADRFMYAKSGAMAHTITRLTDAPTVSESDAFSIYSLLANCTTIDSSIGASDFCAIRYFVEGYDFQKLAQKPFTLSFWVKATKTGTYCVGFNNGLPDRSFVAEYTVNASDTWEKKTINVLASPSAGTWDYTNSVGLIIQFTLASGTNRQTTAGTWQTGNFIATSNQVNACDSTSNNYRLSQIKLETGNAATQFLPRTYKEDLALCQRYYEKTYEQGTFPGTPDTKGQFGAISSVNSQRTFPEFTYQFKVTKRASPTVTIYSPTTGSSGVVRNVTAGSDSTLSSLTTPSETGTGYVSTVSNEGSGNNLTAQMTADAELA